MKQTKSKRIILFLFTVIFLLSFTISANAEESTTPNQPLGTRASLSYSVNLYSDMFDELNAKYYDLVKYLTDDPAFDTYNSGQVRFRSALDSAELTLFNVTIGYVDYQTPQTNLENAYKDFEETYNKFVLDNYDSFDNVNSLTDGLFGVSESLWDTIGFTIKSATVGGAGGLIPGVTSYSSDDIEDFANSFTAVTKTVAYMLLVILFGVNIMETSLQFELFTLRGGVKVFGRLLIAKFWVDLAISICIATLNIINSIGSAIITQTEIAEIFKSVPEYETNSGLWIIGPVIDFFNAIMFSFPLTIMALTVIVVIIIISIKLVIRTFELVCLVTLSPIFFATLIGEHTQSYFKKFFGSFLSVAANIVFIAIVYAVGSVWLVEIDTTVTNNLWTYTLFILPKIIILIAIAVCICKPPKCLTSLVD